MKLEFTRNGKHVTVTAQDEDLQLVEMKSGTDDFVMIRVAPGKLQIDAEPDARTWHI